MEISFNGNRKKEVCFSFSVYEKSRTYHWYCDFLGSWEKLHCEK